MAKGSYIGIADLPQESSLLARSAPQGKSLREVEKGHILNILSEIDGNYSEAARILGISRVTLYNKIRAYGLGVNKNNSS